MTWPDATDPGPGSGVTDYVVRRGGVSPPPGDPTAGTAICKVALPAATGCVDTTALSGLTYGYSVFALDGAGNVARQTVNVKAVDTVAPDAVTGFRSSVGPTNANLIWELSARQGKNADVTGYRVLRLADGVKTPANPKDGTVVCPGLSYKEAGCYVQGLTTGKKVTFAVFAYDEVPNYSPVALLTLIPRGDARKPGVATKVRVTRVGARITMRWVSPRDSDLSHFVRESQQERARPRIPACGRSSSRAAS